MTIKHKSERSTMKRSTRKHLLQLALFTGSALMLGGCGAIAMSLNNGPTACSPAKLQQVNRTISLLETLNIGTSAEEVLASLGEPESRTRYTLRTGDKIEALFYPVQAVGCICPSGYASPYEPIFVQAGLVIGHGTDFFNSTLRANLS